MNTATLGYREPSARPSTGWRGRASGPRALAPEVDGEDVAVVARRIRDAGLAVSGYCRSTYIPAADPAAFAAGLDDNRRAIDQAAVLGADCFVMVVGGLPDGSRDLPDARGQAVEGTGLLHEYARGAGVRLALEPLHPMYAADRSVLSRWPRRSTSPSPRAGRRPTADAGGRVDVYHVWWDPELSTGIERADAAAACSPSMSATGVARARPPPRPRHDGRRCHRHPGHSRGDGGVGLPGCRGGGGVLQRRLVDTRSRRGHRGRGRTPADRHLISASPAVARTLARPDARFAGRSAGYRSAPRGSAAVQLAAATIAPTVTMASRVKSRMAAGPVPRRIVLGQDRTARAGAAAGRHHQLPYRSGTGPAGVASGR